MPGTSTLDSTAIPPTHEDFHWIHGPGQDQSFANFIELSRDVAAGISSSLQIVYANNLVREINQDGDLEQQSAPAIGTTDAQNLFCLSLAAAVLLRNAAQDRIDRLNGMLEE